MSDIEKVIYRMNGIETGAITTESWNLVKIKLKEEKEKVFGKDIGVSIMYGDTYGAIAKRAYISVEYKETIDERKLQGFYSYAKKVIEWASEQIVGVVEFVKEGNVEKRIFISGKKLVEAKKVEAWASSVNGWRPNLVPVDPDYWQVEMNSNVSGDDEFKVTVAPLWQDEPNYHRGFEEIQI